MPKGKITCKLVLVGNGAVGKTSLIGRFTREGFERTYKQTVGIDFFEREVQIQHQSVILQVWDVGGQSASSKMLGLYLHGASCVFLCYDVTNMESFHSIEDWLQAVRAGAAASERERKPEDEAVEPPLLYLTANKIDIHGRREVQQKQHDDFIRSQKLTGGFFVSALNGDNVMASFYQAAAACIGGSLTSHELEFFNQVIAVHMVDGDGDTADERRKKEVAEFERKMAEEEAQQAQQKSCRCSMQ